MQKRIVKLQQCCKNGFQEKHYEDTLFYQRIFQYPSEESFFLFGPRGTGKTTWLKQKYPDALCVDLLNPLEERLFSMHPELLRERLEAAPYNLYKSDDRIDTSTEQYCRRLTQ